MSFLFPPTKQHSASLAGTGWVQVVGATHGDVQAHVFITVATATDATEAARIDLLTPQTTDGNAWRIMITGTAGQARVRIQVDERRQRITLQLRGDPTFALLKAAVDAEARLAYTKIGTLDETTVPARIDSGTTNATNSLFMGGENGSPTYLEISSDAGSRPILVQVSEAAPTGDSADWGRVASPGMPLKMRLPRNASLWVKRLANSATKVHVAQWFDLV